MDRETLRDELGVYALGVLPEAEAETVLAAVLGDTEMRAEYAELRDTADAVALAARADLDQLDEVASARIKRRLLATVRGAEPEATPVAFVKARAQHPWLAYGVAAAALLIAAGSYAASSSLQLQVSADRAALEKSRAETNVALARDRDEIAVASEERRDVEAVLSEHARHFPIGRGKQPGAHGDVISTQGRLYLALTRLGRLPPGKVYQAWTIAKGHPPIPGTTFVPQGDVTVVALGAPVAGVKAVALTVEPMGGSKKPTSKPTFVRRLV